MDLPTLHRAHLFVIVDLHNFTLGQIQGVVSFGMCKSRFFLELSQFDNFFKLLDILTIQLHLMRALLIANVLN